MAIDTRTMDANEIIPAPNAEPAKGTPHSQPARRAWFWTCVKWTAGTAILVWLYRQNAESLGKIAAAPKNWRFALLGLILIAGSNLVMFARWWLLVQAQQFPFPLRDAVRYGFAGLATNFVIPGTIGGDLFKALLLARDQTSRRASAAATVVVDRLLGVLGLFIVGAAATLLPRDFPDSPAVTANTTLLWVGSLGGLALVMLLLIPGSAAWAPLRRLERLPVAGPILADLVQGVNLYQSRPRRVFAALGLSLLNNSGMILGLYCCARSISSPWVPSLASHFYFRPSAELFGALSMIPGGFGALEFAIQEAYVLLNAGAVTDAEASAAGFAAAVTFRAASVLVAAVGFSWYLSCKTRPSLP